MTETELIRAAELQRAAEGAGEKAELYLIRLYDTVVSSSAVDDAELPSLFERICAEAVSSYKAQVFDGDVNAILYGGGIMARCFVSRILRQRYAERFDINVFHENTPHKLERPGRISYFKSPALDTAYEIFSGRLASHSAHFSPDFASGCENVYYGRAEYCILPLSSGKEGRLSGFYSLAEKYGLVGVDECTAENGSSDSRYALMSSKLPPELSNTVNIEIKIPSDDTTLYTVITAAKYFGLYLRGIDGLPTELGESSLIRLSGGRDGAIDLLFFIYCSQISCVIGGIYNK